MSRHTSREVCSEVEARQRSCGIVRGRKRTACRDVLVFVSLVGLWTSLPAAAPLAGTTERVSVASNGNQANAESRNSAISADGRFVAFESSASNLVPGDTNGVRDVFLHDRASGTTTRVSVDSAGNQGNADSAIVAISADGRFVGFNSQATNLVPGGTSGIGDVLLRDRVSGTTTRVSVDSSGNPANAGSSHPALSADGRFVAFNSFASSLVPGDTNSAEDVFVRDRVSGTTTRVSVDSNGNQGNNGSFFPAISADGRFVAFQSFASNLVPGDTNGLQDVFVHDRGTDVAEPPSDEPPPTAEEAPRPGQIVGDADFIQGDRSPLVFVTHGWQFQLSLSKPPETDPPPGWVTECAG